MSLTRFKAQNHPQQTAKPQIDDRATTPTMFAELHARFRFTVDAAASIENAKLPRFWTVADDGLEQPWGAERVWVNPPYSNIRPWVEKAHYEWEIGEVEAIVMILPANRTEQSWWQDLVEPYRDQLGMFDGPRTEFIRGRVRFLHPGATEIGPDERPPFGSVLLIWDRGGVA